MNCLRVIFACLFVFVSTGEASSKIQSLVESQTADLARLTKLFWSFQPSFLMDKGPLVLCKFIDQCCAADEQPQAITAMISHLVRNQTNDYYVKVSDTCTKSSTLQMDNESCALTHELLNPTFTREEKVEIHKLQRTKLVYAHELRVFFNQFRDYCDDEEFHALLCPNSKKTIDKCVGRFLRQIHQINSFRAYHQFVSQTRRTLVLRVRELAAIYPKSADVNQIAQGNTYPRSVAKE